MTGFLILCVAVMALVGWTASLVVGALRLLARGWLATLESASRWRVHMALAALPAVAACGTIVAVNLPALGVGEDHCLMHDHHLHVCMEHGALHGFPGWPILFVTGALLAAALWRGTRLLVALHRAGVIRAHLEGVGREQGGVCIYPGDEPRAFVLGLLRPRLFATEALLRQPPVRREVVFNHEHEHLRRRDPLWRAVAGLCRAFHLPGIGVGVERDLALAAELRADAAAAGRAGRETVAETLIALARRSAGVATAVAFGEGQLEARVVALVEPLPERRGPSPAILAVVAVAGMAALGWFAMPVHHAIETLLGHLS